MLLAKAMLCNRRAPARRRLLDSLPILTYLEIKNPEILKVWKEKSGNSKKKRKFWKILEGSKRFEPGSNLPRN